MQPKNAAYGDTAKMFGDLNVVSHNIIDKDSGWDVHGVVPVRSSVGNVLHLLTDPLKGLALPIKFLEWTGLYKTGDPGPGSIYRLHLLVF